MAKKTKTKAVTLRMPPELHEQVSGIANELFVSVNDLLCQMIAMSLPQFRVEALLVREAVHTGKFIPMFNAWSAANPGRRPKEFLGEFRKHLNGEPSSLDNLNVPE